MPRYRIAFVAFCAITLAATIGLSVFAIRDRHIAAEESRTLLSKPELIAEAAARPPLVLDEEGVRNPQLVSATTATLADDEMIIGVTAFGESRAYVRRAFDDVPARHVVHDKFGAVPVTITHCNRTRCTRVFTAKDGESALDIRCGGWLSQQEMALHVGDQEYAQSSQKIPLPELPFVVMTWKQWQQSQPDSLVYLGPIGAE